MSTRSLIYTSQRTVKTVLIDFSTGERVWRTDTHAFESYNAAHIANYGIAAEEGMPGQYAWTIPAQLPASAFGFEYQAISYDCAGASFAVGDLASFIWLTTFEWDGETVIDSDVPVGNIPAKTTIYGNVGQPIAGVKIEVCQVGPASNAAAGQDWLKFPAFANTDASGNFAIADIVDRLAPFEIRIGSGQRQTIAASLDADLTPVTAIGGAA